jgi:hypothetical protein
MASNSEIQTLERPLEKARNLRERSTRLQAQSQYLRKLVREQHFETLVLMTAPEQQNRQGQAVPRDRRGDSIYTPLPPIRSTLKERQS